MLLRDTSSSKPHRGSVDTLLDEKTLLLLLDVQDSCDVIKIDNSYNQVAKNEFFSLGRIRIISRVVNVVLMRYFFFRSGFPTSHCQSLIS